MAEKSLLARLGLGDNREEERKQGVVLALLVSMTTLAALALLLIWLNLERTKLAYQVRVLQRERETRQDANSRLSLERERLSSPRALGKRAETLGLGPAKPGQIRKGDAVTDTPDSSGGLEKSP